MAAIVWTTMGIAIWHFTVFLPDRFWQGIVGAFLGAWAGSLVTGALFQVVAGRTIGQTDVVTALVAVPGAIIGMAIIWWLGVRREEAEERFE